MDRRSTPRQTITPDDRRIVSVTLLSSDGTSDQTWPAQLADSSAEGLRLLSPHPAPAGTPVRIELTDRLALGHACYCQPEPDGQFSIGVRVTQVLDGLSSLRRLAARLMGESRPESVPSSLGRTT